MPKDKPVPYTPGPYNEPDPHTVTAERCTGCGSELGPREVHVHDKPTRADAVIEPKGQVARDRQVAGSHYQEAGIQPWEIIDAYELDFYRGNALKYLLRAGRKANTPVLDDLRKCAHYLERIIEIEEGKS